MKKKNLAAVIRSVGFIFVLTIVLGCCDYLFAPSGYVRFILHEANDNSDNYETVILGASHSRCGINPYVLDKELDTNTLNLSIPGETVDDSYYVLRDALDSNDIKTVILDVDFQYWLYGQDVSRFQRAFIANQMEDVDTKLLYYFHNRKDIDFRTAFTKRLSWKMDSDSVRENLRVKQSDAYKNYDISSVISNGTFFDGADGPYIGKGYFNRLPLNHLPEGLDSMRGWLGVEDRIDDAVEWHFHRIHRLCKEHNIDLVCVTSPITPKTTEIVDMQKVNDTFTDFFGEKDLDYYDFNLAYMEDIPRQNTDFTDIDGHMVGEVAENYSKDLAEVLKERKHGRVNRKKHFYDSYSDFHKSMRSDYERRTGRKWQDYKE